MGNHPGQAGGPREIHPCKGGRGRFRRVAEPLVLSARTRSTRCSSVTRPGTNPRSGWAGRARPRSRCPARLQWPRATVRSGRRGGRDGPGTRGPPAFRRGPAIRIDRYPGWHPPEPAPWPRPSGARRHTKRRTVATCVCSIAVRTKSSPCWYPMHWPCAMDGRGSPIVKVSPSMGPEGLEPPTVGL